jgi:hypothetical protein
MQPLYRLGDAVTGPLGQNDVPSLVPEHYAGPSQRTVLDVIGPARAWGDFNFVPARIELRRCGALHPRCKDRREQSTLPAEQIRRARSGNLRHGGSKRAPKAARSCSFRSAQLPNAQGSSAGILRRKVVRRHHTLDGLTPQLVSRSLH